MAKLSVSFSLSYVSPAVAAGDASEAVANEHSSSLRVRLMSEWCSCTQLSEVLGEGATAWQSTEEELLDESQPRRALKTCTYSVEVDLPDFGSRERLEQMHAAPGLYAVVLRQESRTLPTESPDTPAVTEQRLVPVSFVYCDCSRFLVEAGRITATGQRVGPRVAPAVGEAPVDPALLPVPSIVVSVASALLPRDVSTPLEPLMLEFSSLGGFPVTTGSSTLGGTLGGTLSVNAAPELGNVYIYGRLDLGGTTRIIHARPSQQAEAWKVSDDVGPIVEAADQAAALTGMLNMLNTANTASTEGGFKGADHYPLDCRVCCLPGLADLPRFKEALSSSTFVIQLHAEDVNARAFHPRACEEYHEAVLEAAAAAGATPAAAPPAAKAPARGAPAAAAPASPAIAQPAAFTAADSFLLAQISRALQVGSEIQAHGAARLRLEHLLEQSSDLLAEFRRRRAGLQEEAAAGTGADGAGAGLSALPAEEDVVVREDVLAEIRLAKPSKPLKWHLPADVSLRGALERDVIERQSRADGTMALVGSSSGGGMGAAASATGTGTSGGGGGGGGGRGLGPWFEQLHAFGTRVVVSAELHRRLSHPVEPPKVFLKVVESFVKDGLTTKTTVASKEHLEALQRRLAITPFSRMVFAFKYDDDDTLLAINAAITKVNTAALRDIQGSIRSYTFSDAELAAAEDGSLDVVTGFMVLDDDQRLVVLEGLAAPGKGMQSVFLDLPRTKANDINLKILASPECLFSARLYGSFGPDLKRVRVRDRLKRLARRPELYNRRQVEELCFSAVDAVMALRRAPALRATKELDMYPCAEALCKVELLYGEAVSRADLDGTASETQRAAQRKESKRRKAQEAADHAAYCDEIYGPSAAALAAAAAAAKTSKRSHAHSHSLSQPLSQSLSLHTAANNLDTYPQVFDRQHPRCAPTDARNPDFEAHLASRPAHRVDFLAEQREALRQAYENALHRTAARDELSHQILLKVLGREAVEAAGSAGPKIYCYASQAENFKVKAFAELRGRIAKVTDGATYTFSKDFISQTVCTVDEDADRKIILAEKRSHWLTQTGFTYPKPKTLQDLITHPKKPSESRAEDLRDPFPDAGPASSSSSSSATADAGAGADAAAELLRLERGYSTRIKGGDLFGALRPAAFERDFQLSLVGDRASLPRGRMVGGTAEDKDPAAFRSVHLGGEGQARIVEEAVEREKAEWAAKVVVADTSFKVGGFKTKEKVFQFERTRDILKDPPARRELKALRARASASGKSNYSYAPAPLSLLSSGPYVANAAAEALVRKAQPDKFTTAREVRDASGALVGKPRDFVRFIDRNANAPRIMCVLSKREIAPLQEGEQTGPRWEATPAPAPSRTRGGLTEVTAAASGHGWGAPAAAEQ